MVLNRNMMLCFIALSCAVCTQQVRGKTDDMRFDMKAGDYTRVRAYQKEMKAITNADQCDGLIIVDKAGSYRVSEDLEYPVVITAHNIQFDLCGYTLCACPESAVLTIAAHCKNVSVVHGKMQGAGVAPDNCGILIKEAAEHVFVEDIKIFDCATGVFLCGLSENKIKDCEFKSIECSRVNSGMRFVHAEDVIVKECCSSRCTAFGFNLQSCESISFYSCHVLKAIGHATFVGFNSCDGKNNFFYRCVAKDIISLSNSWGDAVYGFRLCGYEDNTKIAECSVSDVRNAPESGARVCGIYCQPEHDITLNCPMYDFPAIVLASAWSYDSKFLACGLACNSNCSVCIRRRDTHLLTPVAQQVPSAGDVFAVAWSPDAHFLAYGDSLGFLNIARWTGETLEVVVHEDITSPVCCLAWSPNGQYLACGDGDKNIRMYSFDGIAIRQKSINDTCASSVLALAWSSDGRYVASGDFSGAVRVYRVCKTELICETSDVQSNDHVWSVAWSPDRNVLAVGRQSGKVQFFSALGQQIVKIRDEVSALSAVQAVGWSPDGKILMSGHGDGCVIQHQLGQDNYTVVLNDKVYDGVQNIAWAADGSIVIGGDSRALTRFYSARDIPHNCLIENCRICDIHSQGSCTGVGAAGCGMFVRNVCCNNDVNYGYGVGNVMYGKHNQQRHLAQAFDNISMPAV